MPSTTELIEYFPNLRMVAREVFVNGYRPLKCVVEGDSRVMDLPKSTYRKWLTDLLNFTHGALLRDEQHGDSPAWFTVSEARLPENPLYRLLKAHKVSETDLDFHFSILAELEEACLVAQSSRKGIKRYLDDPYAGVSTDELYDSFCWRQTTGGTLDNPQWRIIRASVDGSPLKGDPQRALTKAIGAEGCNRLRSTAIALARRKSGAFLYLPEGYHLFVFGDCFRCYRNGQQVNREELQAFWAAQERPEDFGALLQRAQRRAEEYHMKELPLDSIRVKSFIPLDWSHLFLLPQQRVLSIKQLRSLCSHEELASLQSLLLYENTDRCTAEVSGCYGGKTASLTVGLAAGANAPMSQTTFGERLGDYVAAGLILRQRLGDSYVYRPSPMRPHLYGQGLFDQYRNLPNAILFFSEVSPLGIIGSQIMDHAQLEARPFTFRDRYFAHALDSLILYDVLEAIRCKQLLRVHAERHTAFFKPETILQPLCILSDLQQGRQYLYGYEPDTRQYRSMRLDMIRTVAPDNGHPWDADACQRGLALLDGAWSSRVHTNGLMGVELELAYNPETESYIPDRVIRERRQAQVDIVQDGHMLLGAAVHDPRELLPWILTLTGRVDSIRSDSEQLPQRYRQHIESMHRRYTADAPGTVPFQPGDRSYTAVPIEPDKGRVATISPLFQDLSSSYITCHDRILRAFGRKLLPEKEARELIRQVVETYGFRNTASAVGGRRGITLESLLEERLLYRSPDGCIGAGITRLPSRALTFCELRWLLSILPDPRMRLFLDQEQINELEETLRSFLQASGDVPEPLYTSETYRVVGVCRDPDPYANEAYWQHFSTLLSFTLRRAPVQISYKPLKRGQERTICLLPLKLEFSLQRDKFSFYGLDSMGRVATIRLSTINRVGRAPDDASLPLQDDTAWESCLKSLTTRDDEALELLVSQENNALERFMLEFSVYRKSAVLDPETGTARVKVWYLRPDRSEIIIKLLRYGQALEVLGPADVREEITQRVAAQYQRMQGGLAP